MTSLSALEQLRVFIQRCQSAVQTNRDSGPVWVNRADIQMLEKLACPTYEKPADAIPSKDVVCVHGLPLSKPCGACSFGTRTIPSNARVQSAVETECARCKEHEQFRHQHRDCDKLAVALRGLYWDQVDYLTLNKLGGMNNHWMRAAREALGMDPNDTSVSPSRPELRHDSPEIQFADVFAELEKGHPVDTRDAINALWWKVGNQRRELARRAQKAEAPHKCPIHDVGCPICESLKTGCVSDSETPMASSTTDLGGKL